MKNYWTNKRLRGIKSTNLTDLLANGQNFFDRPKATIITYYCDNQRHLVCKPYSIANLHEMANQLNIKRCWFHRDHYDIPKRRIQEITKKCEVVSPKDIVNIIQGKFHE